MSQQYSIPQLRRTQRRRPTLAELMSRFAPLPTINEHDRSPSPTPTVATIVRTPSPSPPPPSPRTPGSPREPSQPPPPTIARSPSLELSPLASSSKENHGSDLSDQENTPWPPTTFTFLPDQSGSAPA